MQYDVQFNVTSLMTQYLLQMLLLIDKGHLPLQKGQFLVEEIKKFCLQMYLQKMKYPHQILMSFF